MTVPYIEVYAMKGCGLCKEARKVIGKVRRDIPFQFKEVDIASSDELQRRYKEQIPTIFINGKKAFKFRVDEGEFRKQVRREIIRAGTARMMSKRSSVT